MKAILMLEDGKNFVGESLGIQGEAIGELIFNTAVVGYQEMITDPANSGKILVLTYPLIGNYGVAPKFNESKGVWPSGLIFKEKSRIVSNWQAKDSLDNFVKIHKLLTITGVDTRTLAVHLRQKGSMLGIVSTKTSDAKELLSRIESFRNRGAQSILPKISVTKAKTLGPKRAKLKIAILDLGIQNSLIKQLETLGLYMTVLPYNTPAEQILGLKPQGLIISGGPEDDIGLKDVAANVKKLIGQIPILGISAGHEVLAAALGAKVIKMKLGHHGVNYPIQYPASYKGEITVQNHSYVVDAGSLNKIRDVKIIGFNLNDRTVEEIESRKLKLLGVQYIPASPGFAEVNSALKKFIKIIKKE
ncbi:MAG: carbamoyl phosphate synthase small subunit [Omnitrophica WOR_2 bacterium RBG_13_44_8b]|nr:MAG: carbamoyl phosphate synthase small subunit [Omnitrophica WOR_2 bacterium RBG_13_44_8b]